MARRPPRISASTRVKLTNLALLYADSGKVEDLRAIEQLAEDVGTEGFADYVVKLALRLRSHDLSVVEFEQNLIAAGCEPYGDIFIRGRGCGPLAWALALKELVTMDNNQWKRVERLLVFLSGIVFVGILLAVAMTHPNPTTFQYTVIRMILSLAAAAVAVFIDGFLNVTIPKYIKAGGALGVFVVVYFFAPAAL